MSSLAKAFFQLQKNLGGLTNNQVTVEDQDDSLEWFNIEIYPQDGPYQYGKFYFKIQIPDDFPETAPVINCITDIYHPNIDTSYQCEDSGNICVSLLDEWDGSQDLEDVIQALLFLFYNPNLDDPLSSVCISEPLLAFEEKVYKSLLGKLTEEDNVSPEFLTVNFHPPESETIDDYMLLQPIFHDVRFDSNSKIEGNSNEDSEAEEENNEEEQDEEPSGNSTNEAVAAEAGPLVRQQSKIERMPELENKVSTAAANTRRLFQGALSQGVCRELAAATLSVVTNLVTIR